MATKEYTHFVPAVPVNDKYEDDKTYVLIESIDQLKEILNKGRGFTIAWDTETTGLNPEESEIVGYSFTFDGRTGYYCPVKHYDLALGKSSLDLFYESLKNAQYSLLYNARFDIRIMEYSGYDMSFLYSKDNEGVSHAKFFDVMNMSWLSDTNVVLPSLKKSTLHFLGFQPPKFLDTLGTEENFQYVPAKDAYRYACLDAINTYNLARVTFKYYKEAGLAAKMDDACIYIIGQLEKQPLNINTAYLVELRDKVYQHVLDLEQDIYRLAGRPFKIGSNRELTQVFMEQGIDTGERTKAGDMKTSKELLSLYLREHPECDLLNKIIEYKEQFKFYNSYLKTLVDIAKKQESVPPRFSYKLQSVPCLTENNVVLIKGKGLVSIAHVFEQEEIWTQYGYKRILWNNSHKDKGVYRVYLNNSLYIEGTNKHPILINKGTSTDIQVEWATLESIKIGEHVVLNHHTPALGIPKDSNFNLFMDYLGFITAPLFNKAVSLLPEYDSTLSDFRKNSTQAFKTLVDNIMNNGDAIIHIVSRSEPCDWVAYIKSLIYAIFETDASKQWNPNFLEDHCFCIYVENAAMTVLLSSLLGYLGIQTYTKYLGDVFSLEFKSDQSLVLFKNLIVNNSNSKYLIDLFSPISDYYIEYEDAVVQSVEYIPGEVTVYDIEVEDVHEYVANGIVTHNSGRLSCLTGDTLIPTILGDIPIGELSLYEDGNEVYTDANSTAQFHTLYMGEKPVVEIHLDNGKSIKATLDHRFMDTTTEWVYVNDLKVGDSLLSVVDNKLTQTKITNIIPIEENQSVWTLSVNHVNHQYISNSLISHNCGKDGKNTYFAPVNLQCLEENTLVKTDRGNVPIKNVTKDDLIWTGTRFVHCQPLGHKRKHCYKIKTLWGEIEASLEHRFFTLSHKTWEFEWHTLGECILYHYPLVRDPQDLGISFDELYHYKDYNETKRNKKRELSLEEYKEYLDLYKECKFDVIIESPREFWNTKMDVPYLIKTVYDLYVPEYNQFTANGFIVHNSLPKPKSVKCYGRKATQEEKNQHLDVLGWMFSPDHPEWSPGQVVEGMKQNLNVRAAFLPEHPENGDYVVSIDMSSEELRVVTNLYKEENWARVILNGGDLHHANSDAIFGKENYTKETRKKAKCISGKSIIFTTEGIKNLEDLCDKRILGEPQPINFTIATPEGLCKASYFIYNGVRNTKILHFKDGTILETTPDHIVQSRKLLKKVEDLCVGDVVDYGTNSIEIEDYQEIDLPFITGCKLPITEDIAYLLGAILGDGTLNKKNVKYMSIDLELIEEVKRIVFSLNLSNKDPYTEHMYQKKFNRKFPVTYINCGSKRLLVLLECLGINRNNHKDLVVPEIIFRSPTSVRGRFIRGLFDTDGWVGDKDFAIGFCTKSLSFAKSVHYLLLSLGILNTITFSYNKVYQRDYYKIRIALVSSRQFLDKVGFCNNKKRNRLVRHLVDYIPIKSRIPRKEIIKIEDSKAEVFDLTVENKSHLFYANGFIVHNCAAFGLLYGQEYQGFQRKFPDMSLEEAKEFMSKFKKAIPHIIHGQDRTIRDAMRTGTFYTAFGRPFRVKSYFTSPDRKDQAFGKRITKNGPIQGTAADVLKLEFVRLWDNIFTQYPEIKFICTIHDEINFSVPRHLADEVIPKLIKCMTVKLKDWLVQLDCSLSAGPTLGQQYNMKYNFLTKEFEPDWEEDTRKESNKEENKEDTSLDLPEEDHTLDSLISIEDEQEEEEKKVIEEKPIEVVDSKMFDF